MAIQDSVDARRVAETYFARHNTALAALDAIEQLRAQLVALPQAQRDALTAMIDARYGDGVAAEIQAGVVGWQRVRASARTTEGFATFEGV